jgi:agmatinase
MKFTGSFALLLAVATAHSDHSQVPIEGPHKSLWYNTLPGDGGTQVMIVLIFEAI